MNSEEAKLDSLLRSRGLDWAIDMFAPSSAAVRNYLDALNSLEEFMTRKGLGDADFSSDALEHLVTISPYKADAFLQALVSIRTTPILCASWRILQGVPIGRVEVSYERLSKFSLRVSLQPDEGNEETYESSDINDAVFLRHLGKSSIDGRPYFDGFYALRQT